MTNKILSVTIGPMPKSLPLGLFDPLPSVTATFADGTVKRLFEFYPCELGFTAEEFVGLTEAEARILRHKKDVAYLRTI